MHTSRRWIILASSLAVTCATFYFVVRGLDRRIFVQLIATQNSRWITAAAGFVLLQIGLAGARWRAILAAMMRGSPPSRSTVQAVFYASVFFNCLPVGTIGGDVARIWLARNFALSMNQLVLSVLVDRALVVIALVVLSVFTLPSIDHPLAVPASLVCAGALFTGVCGLFLLRPVEVLLGKWRNLHPLHLLLRTVEELRRVFVRGGPIGLGWAVASAMSATLAAFCIAHSLSIEVELMPITAVMSIVAFVTALPISFAGWGVREASVVGLLGLLGVDRGSALLLSLEFGIIATLMSLPGGIVWLLMRQRLRSAVPTA
ncbi:MAG: lysylphosphatidylglycerol synthase transmembrane domain-containing protein [Beijerinckiaceae bacterium]|jgi:glycosyltransferase 2 family protein